MKRVLVILAVVGAGIAIWQMRKRQRAAAPIGRGGAGGAPQRATIPTGPLAPVPPSAAALAFSPAPIAMSAPAAPSVWQDARESVNSPGPAPIPGRMIPIMDAT